MPNLFLKRECKKSDQIVAEESLQVMVVQISDTKAENGIAVKFKLDGEDHKVNCAKDKHSDLTAGPAFMNAVQFKNEKGFKHDTVIRFSNIRA